MDNVSLNAVPIPAAAWLLGTGPLAGWYWQGAAADRPMERKEAGAVNRLCLSILPPEIRFARIKAA
jgi:hypothetical protein